jgi:hypothetical protein
VSELGMITTCPCGSGEPRRELIDARGIFCEFVCDACEEEKGKEFRPEIFTDWTDVSIEEKD